MFIPSLSARVREIFLGFRAVAIALVLVLVACGSPGGGSGTTEEGAPSGEPVVLGVPLPVGGAVVEVGRRALQGAEFAVEDINASGGVMGRPLEINVQDDKCDPGEGANAIQNLIANPSVSALVGVSCSSVALAVMPIIDGKIALVLTGASSPAITEAAGVGGNEWVFRVNPSDADMAEALMDVMVNDHNKTRAVIIAQNDDFGRAAADAFQQFAEAAGGEILDKQFYPVGGPYEFSSIVTRFRVLEPDAVIFAGTVEGGIPLVDELRLQGLDISVYTRGLPLVPSTFEALGDKADGIHGVDPHYPQVDTAANRAFVDRFTERFDEPPHFQAFSQYEAIYLLKSAIEAAGSTDRSAVRDAVEGQSYESATGGTVAFDDHNQAHNRVFIAKASCSGGTCAVEVVGSRDT
jgi:branched-chain amino acid transport system substrate-binding protein